MTDKESKVDWIGERCQACGGTGSAPVLRPV